MEDWETGSDGCDCVLGAGNLLLGSITLLVLTQLAGEEDQAAAVCL